MTEREKHSGDFSRAVKVAALMVEPADHLAWQFMVTLITKHS